MFRHSLLPARQATPSLLFGLLVLIFLILSETSGDPGRFTGTSLSRQRDNDPFHLGLQRTGSMAAIKAFEPRDAVNALTDREDSLGAWIALEALLVVEAFYFGSLLRASIQDRRARLRGEAARKRPPPDPQSASESLLGRNKVARGEPQLAEMEDSNRGGIHAPTVTVYLLRQAALVVEAASEQLPGEVIFFPSKVEGEQQPTELRGYVGLREIAGLIHYLADMLEV